MSEKSGNEVFIEEVRAIIDPSKMLACILENSHMLGDSYYSVLTEPMIDQADKILKQSEKRNQAMKVTSITVTRTVKVNLGNYENTDLQVSMTAELEVPTDEVPAIHDQHMDLVANVESALRTELTRIADTSDAKIKRPSHYGL